MAHSTNGYQARASFTPASTSTLRPRVGRLISGLDDDTFTQLESGPSLRAASPRGTPRTSRPASPIPTRYPSRTNPSSRTGSQTPGARNARDSSVGSFSGLFGSSWTTIQGLASSVLGSGADDASYAGTSPGRAPRGTRRPHTRSTASEPPNKWGPSEYKTAIGAGSEQERAALVREAKRKDLLAADGQTAHDLVGRHKRRISDDVTPHVQIDEPEAALVYVHHVKLGDTIPGLAIRYHCSQAAIRKANRLWSNDAIQSRKTLVLPVDECAVKGRRLDTWAHEIETAEDLLGDENITMHESPCDTPNLPAGWDMAREPSIQSSTSKPSASDAGLSSTGRGSDLLYTHDCWVSIPNFSERVEIARLPRRQLGYFPRTRRKSVTFSDFSTPKASLDVPRSMQPSPRASPALRPTPTRNRSSSQAKTFAALLKGPGGVGTLDRTTRLPGPASDRFNELLGPHLPNVEPPPDQTAYTPWYPSYFDRNGDIFSSMDPNSALNVANAQNTKPPMDFQEIGSAIETWMRKTARKATSTLDRPAGAAVDKATALPIGGTSGLDDLIELVDSVDLNDSTPEGDSALHDPRLDEAFPAARPIQSSGLAQVRARPRGLSNVNGKAKKGD